MRVKDSPKILIIGHARHGKSTACEFFKEVFDLTYMESSRFYCEKVVFPQMTGYATPEECYADRVNHRETWYNLIKEAVKDDPAKLGRELFAQYDIYCGARSRDEFEAMKAEKLFDACLWIDRSEGLPPEPETSMDLTPDDADTIIDNNKTTLNLEMNLSEWYLDYRYGG